MLILNALERERFALPPVFTSVQRREHFDFPSEVLHLAVSLRTLYAQYLTTNQHLLTENNPWVTCAADGTLRISTPKQEEREVESLQTFFPERQYVSLLEVLATVNRYSGFLEEFQHWQQRYHHAKPPHKSFFAGIIGLGCGIGTRKIARISRQISEAELEYTVHWFFSHENLHAANDKTLHLIDQLELPNVYRQSPDVLHTASDGQKFTVRADPLNANHSFKYFDKEKGVSVYSFIDERHLLFHSSVISAAERESAYVIDGLMHNDVVQSNIHSTDTHGYSARSSSGPCTCWGSPMLSESKTSNISVSTPSRITR
jgi:hypothetical protein